MRKKTGKKGKEKNNRKGQKTFQTLTYAEEPFYGKSDITTGEIQVNIQFLWELSKGDEDAFIRLFSVTYSHELIHTLIENILMDLYSCGEERMIRILLQERWDKGIDTYYQCGGVSPTKKK